MTRLEASFSFRVLLSVAATIAVLTPIFLWLYGRDLIQLREMAQGAELDESRLSLTFHGSVIFLISTTTIFVSSWKLVPSAGVFSETNITLSSWLGRRNVTIFEIKSVRLIDLPFGLCVLEVVLKAPGRWYFDTDLPKRLELNSLFQNWNAQLPKPVFRFR